MCVRELLIKHGVTVNQLSHQCHVGRSVIYQSLHGDGSRQIRIIIAQLVNICPSELWADNPVFKKTLDDALFNFDSNKRI